MALDSRALALAVKLQELGASPVEIVETLEEVGENIKEERVYKVLKKINPELAEQFRKEMSLYVWRSDIRREPFKRHRIVKSLIKETGISKSLAEKIAREVEEKIRETDLSFITSSLIRELVTIKLIEYGMEDAYRRYFRLGVPVFDLTVLIKKGREGLAERVAERIFQQYSILYLFPKNLIEALFEGFIEVHGIKNPFVPYAQTYYTRVSEPERWFTGLISYLLSKEYVDTPSVFVPDFLDKEHLVLLQSIKRASKAILWSSEDVEGVVRSEIPVYSFGRVPDRRVLDLVDVNVEKVYLSSSDYLKRLEEISGGLETYQERKKEYVRAGGLYVRLSGFSSVPEGDREKVEDIFSEFGLLKA